jgi:uncharacterized protein YfaS (alpha-2-macroglobulin family)
MNLFKSPNAPFRWALIGLFFISIFVALFWWAKSSSSAKTSDPEAYTDYIEAYSNGLLRKDDVIRIRFKQPMQQSGLVDSADLHSLLKIKPSTKGKIYWEDGSTLVFRPNEPWQRNKTYIVSTDLQKLFGRKAPKDPFIFSFDLLNPSFEVSFARLRPANGDSYEFMELLGEVHLADREDSLKVRELLEVRFENKILEVEWQHQPDLRRSIFLVKGISRKKDAGRIQLLWNGNSIGSSKKEEQLLRVPALGSFEWMSHEAIGAPDQQLILYFSDPLHGQQVLDGLVQMLQIPHPSFSIIDNAIHVYVGERLEGEYEVQISLGIRNSKDQSLANPVGFTAQFQNTRPSVHLPSKGTILPHSQALRFPFEAINLRKVDVTIIQIPSQNVPQYVQTSGDGSYELRRVGRPVVQKTISLQGDPAIDLTKRNRFTLDLQDLLETEPGAIYRVLIGFRKEYSLFTCQEQDEKSLVDDEDGFDYRPEDLDDHTDFWSRYNTYYPAGYRWEERENPCHISYYTSDRWVSRDVMASRIGVIAKLGKDQKLQVYTTDINSTASLGQVDIEVLDYQQQIIATGQTDGSGHTELSLIRKPYLIRASKGKERAYLKIDDGSALLLSRFDVTGMSVQKGIKGFIYGERGVWRPGDTVFLTFIYASPHQDLPPNHPITLEWINPKGQVVQKMVEHEHVSGFYSFKIATSTDAPTGQWQVKIQAGGAIFTKSIKVETLLPNRFKIQLDLRGQKVLTSGKSHPISLQADWLFGAPAAQMKTKVEALVLPFKTNFETQKQFHFDDPTKSYPSQTMVLYEGTTNAAGQAAWQWNIPVANEAPGMLRAQLTSRVIEPGGAFSIHQEQVTISPYQRYIGLKLPAGDVSTGMLPTDQNHPVQIVLVDPHGKNIAASSKVRVELYKIRWRWWWSQEEEFNGNFSQDRYNQLLNTEIVELKQGKVTWNLRINEPEWGRFLIRVTDLEGGHSAGMTTYLDWPGWASRGHDIGSSEAVMLSFSAQKSTVEVGEEIILTIPSSEGGRGLISLENGTQVLESKWVETTAKQTVVRFKATAQMAPTLFAHVTLLQPHAQTANDLPIRMYGVIPLEIKNPQTELTPVIQVPKVWKPESKVSVTVSEIKGKAMNYTLALVDEGLLDLTRFQTPQPHHTFYAKEALGVRTWDLFDQVIGAWGGNIERVLGIGGDAEGQVLVHPAKANRFPPVVRYLGPFHLKKGQKMTHKVDLPAYVGSLRVMVVAGHEGAYGSAEQTVQVRQPLMVLGTAPRQIAPGEAFQLPITVFAMEPSIKQVEVNVQTSRHFKVSQAQHTVKFAQVGEEMVFPKLTTLVDSGVGFIQIHVKSGTHQASYRVEMHVQNPNPLVHSVESITLASQKSFQKTFQQAKGLESRIEVSALPAIRLQQRFSYLIQYPHGCLEQVTSGLFPQLYVGLLQSLTKQEQASIQRNIQMGIKQLQTYQLPNGGFGYWPNQGNAEDWSSIYVGHFMLEAERMGFALPSQMKENWLRYQQERARQWTTKQVTFRGGDLIQAYRLYALALAKSADLGAMNRLKTNGDLSTEAAWRLAAAYLLVGQKVVANQLMQQYKDTKRTNEHFNATFGSTLRDLAMRLETTVLSGNQQEATAYLKKVAAQLGQEQWYSTQTTAYALLAIGRYLSTFDTALDFSYMLDGSKKNYQGKHYLHTVIIAGDNKQHPFKIENQSKQPLEIRVIQRVKKPMVASNAQMSDSKAVRLQLRYMHANGEAIQPAQITQGTDFIAELRVTNTGTMGDLTYLALTQMVPSGWEILNSRFLNTQTADGSSEVDYEDIRDDRVMRYFSLRSGQTKVFRMRLHAAYRGTFYMPATVVEDMYDGNIGASTESNWVEVLEELQTTRSIPEEIDEE